MEEIMKKCDARTLAYKNGKTFIQCTEIAKKLSLELEEKINLMGGVEWGFILEKAQYDELVYKLTLKYLRQDGYEIGNWKTPRVTKTKV